MPTLLIKLKNGEVHSGKFPLHFMLMEDRGLDYEDVAAVGVLTKDREV